MFNTTNLTSTPCLSYNLSGSTIAASNQTLDPVNNLGYGLGKIVRGAFDHLYQSWQKMWTQESTNQSLVKHKQIVIYRQGLRECVKHLNAALDHVRKNPRDPSSFKRMQSLVEDYALYLKPQENSELLAFQQKTLQPLQEKISKLAHARIKNAVKELLPVAFQLEGALSGKPKRAVQQTSGFHASFDLTTLDGTNGFKIDGLAAGDKLGHSLSTAGDLNGDGIADIVLGAPSGDPGGRSYAGIAYVLFGQASGWLSSFNLTNLDGVSGFKIEGLAQSAYLSDSVSSAGDLNGDGIGDLVIGAKGANPGGTVYVIFGQTIAFPGSFNLTTLDGANGFKVDGLAASDLLGSSVSGAGDLNGDGIDDLALGAAYASPGGRISAGTVYVLFGQTSGWPSSFNLTLLNGTNGFKIEGLEPGDRLGDPVSSAGDINGDGVDDLVLGLPYAAPDGNPRAGTVYVVLGQTSQWPASFNLATLNGTNGFKVLGLATNNYLGTSVSTAGDFNGDGKDDLVLGANGAAPGGNSHAGTAYVLFGQEYPFPASFNLTTLNGTNGFIVEGFEAYDNLGWSVSSAGDMNGDGKDEIVLGAIFASPIGRSNAGIAYILFGQTDGWISSFNLTLLNGTNGFKVEGVAEFSELGSSVSTAGDLNDDGISDLLLGGPASGLLTGNSTVFVIFGKNTTQPEPTPTPSPAPIISSTSMTPTPSPPPTPSPSPISSPTSPTTPTPTPSSSPSPAPIISPTVVTPTPSPVFSPSPLDTPTPLSLDPPTIEINIPLNLNTTFIPLTADVISISNSTATVRLIDSNGYAIVFTGNYSSVPLSTAFSPLDVAGFSIARGNATAGAAPVFEGCNAVGECILSNATSPLGQVFTTEGVDWKIIVPTVLGTFVLIGSGALIFYFAYYKKRQNGQAAFKKATPLTDITVQQDRASPQQGDASHRDKHLQIASAYHNTSY